MKMSLPGVVLLGAGVILLYAAVKNVNPVDVAKHGLGGPKPSPYKAAGSGTEPTKLPDGSPMPPPGTMTPWGIVNPSGQSVTPTGSQPGSRPPGFIGPVQAVGGVHPTMVSPGVHRYENRSGQ